MEIIYNLFKNKKNELKEEVYKIEIEKYELTEEDYIKMYGPHFKEANVYVNYTNGCKSQALAEDIRYNYWTKKDHSNACEMLFKNKDEYEIIARLVKEEEIKEKYDLKLKWRIYSKIINFYNEPENKNLHN
jgi:hypothetical protein